MDKLILEKKIDSILRAIHRIENRTPETIDAFLKDIDAQDVVTLNLTRIIQLCVDIAMHIIATSNAVTPQTMSESFSTLEKLEIIDTKTKDKLKKSVGFRNIAVHNYGELDLELSFKIAREHLGDFKGYIKQILKSDPFETVNTVKGK